MNEWTAFLQAGMNQMGPHGARVVGVVALLLGSWLVSRLARSAVQRVATDRNLDQRLRSPGMTALLANLAYWLVWLLALPALLGAMGLDGLLAPVNAMMERLLGTLPGFLGAAAIFAVGFFAARILREVVTGVLTAAGSERVADRLGLGTALGDRTLAGVVGSVVFALVLLPTVLATLQAMGLEVVAKPVALLLDSVVNLVPKLISAAIIVVVGIVLGRMLASVVSVMLASAGLNRLPAALGFEGGGRALGREPSEMVGGLVLIGAVLLAATQACEVIGFSVLTEAMTVLGALFARLIGAAVILVAGLWVAAVAARTVAASSVNNASVLSRLLSAVVIFFTGALTLRQAGLPPDIVTIAFASVFGAAARLGAASTHR
jgi:Conserved TM helix